MPGKFITMEGIDGAGKSAATEAVVRAIQNAGFEVFTTREVGGTEMGEAIRNLVLSPDSEIYPNAEILLMFAARSQHLEQVIYPRLKAGIWVVCDRFTDSTYAYQGGGRQTPFERISLIEDWTQGEFRPDLTLLYDTDIDTAWERVRKENSPDRFENEALDFHTRVRSTFFELFLSNSERIKRVDANLPVEKVKKVSQQYINEFIQQCND